MPPSALAGPRASGGGRRRRGGRAGGGGGGGAGGGARPGRAPPPLVREILPFPVHGRIEELAEWVEEQDPREDMREHLELGVPVLQLHELMAEGRFELIPV